MRVRVDESRCQGHTLCAMIAPESFALDDVDGHARAIVEDVPSGRQTGVLEAANSCPEQAITVTIEHVVAARVAHGEHRER